MVRRHEDDGTTIYDFGDRFLVRCPQCDACATVTRVEQHRRLTTARLTCTACGKVKERQFSSWAVGGAADWYFGLPLWLQRSCCGETLWAYSLEHLAYLDSYVGASLRTRRLPNDSLVRNKALASRLPQWMKSAKNREKILDCIDALRKTVDT